MVVDIFLFVYTVFLSLVALWAAYSSYLVIKCGVPPVPTPQRITTAMIKVANISQNQQVYDLGCGFGTVLFAAQKSAPNNQFYGYEINRPVLWWAKMRNHFSGGKIEFHSTDFFHQDLGQADVIFCYLWPSIMDRIERQIWPTLKPGAKVVSHGFPLGNTEAREVIKIGRSKIFVYVKDL